MIALLAPVLGVGSYKNFNQDGTIYVGQDKDITYVSSIEAPTVYVYPTYTTVYDPSTRSYVDVMTDVDIDIAINHTYRSINFTKGLMVSE